MNTSDNIETLDDTPIETLTPSEGEVLPAAPASDTLMEEQVTNTVSSNETYQATSNTEFATDNQAMPPVESFTPEQTYQAQNQPMAPESIPAAPIDQPMPVEMITPPNPEPVAPTPYSLNDMVTPTNLNQTNINNFGQENIPINNFNQNPKPSNMEMVSRSDQYNSIGTVPETYNMDQKPQKEKKNPKGILLIAIILIAAIGIGIFLYLRLGNKKVNIKTKNIKIQVSDTISTNVNDYVENGQVDSSCVANFDEVKVNEIGTYTYKIICNSGTYPGTIEVVDEMAPDVSTKAAFKTIGQAVSEEDFIESCNDASGCTYSFVNEDIVKTNIMSQGTYDVEISVKDGQNNEKKVTSYLLVTEASIDRKLNCVSEDITGEDGYTYVIKDSIGIIKRSGDLVYAGFTMRNYILTFDDEDAYKAMKNSIKEDGSIETKLSNGKASYDDSNKQIIIMEFVKSDKLNNEFGSYPEQYSKLRVMYQNDEKGYSCNAEFLN